MKRRCIITAGISAREPDDHPRRVRDYRRGLDRIEAGLRNTGYSGGFLSWLDCYPKGSPPQRVAPFAFKPFCFSEARARGYEIALWLDASIVIKAPLDPLWEVIENEGYLIFSEIHSVGEYCADPALAPLGIGRDESFLLPCCRAGALGLDFTNATAARFLRQWGEKAVDGVTFPGPKWSGVRGWPGTASSDPRVHGHRHDQTAASVIAWKLGMNRWRPPDCFGRHFDIDRDSLRATRLQRSPLRHLARLFTLRSRKPRDIEL